MVWMKRSSQQAVLRSRPAVVSARKSTPGYSPLTPVLSTLKGSQLVIAHFRSDPLRTKKGRAQSTCMWLTGPGA